MINMKVRFKNPMFIVQLIVAIATPVLAYFGLTVADLTTWDMLAKVILDALSNPYVLILIIVNVVGAINDPTTKGFTDSKLAMTYEEPKED